MASSQPGSKIENAFQILAHDGAAGVGAEYRLIDALYGRRNHDWAFCGQRLLLHAGRYFDEITIMTREDVEETLFFDICSFHSGDRRFANHSALELPEQGSIVVVVLS